MRSNFLRNLATVSFVILTSTTVFASGEGRIVSVVGNVTINGAPAKVGDIVPQGAKVETQSGSSASVLFGQESVMNISAESRITVDSIIGNKVNTKLEKGQVDGVKKIGSSTSETITVNTVSAKFELTGGRFSVMEQGENQSFLAMDGNASVTYLKDSANGKRKAGTVQTFDSQLLLTVKTAPGSGPAATDVETKKVTEEQAKEIRSAAQITTNNSGGAAQIANNIVASGGGTQPPPAAGDRGPASSGPGVGDAPKSPVSQLQPVQPGRQIPKDPAQQIPGRTGAAVKVIFQP